MEKIVIVGSGPAAWTCAIYAARASLNPLVYEGAITEENRLRGTLPLGQLNLTTEVENFPGFPEGVLGPELMLRMRRQSERYGTRIITEDVVSVDLSRRPFVVTDSAGKSVQTHALVVATGASANYLGLASEQRFKNHGVSACAVCDGALPRFRNRPLVVVEGEQRTESTRRYYALGQTDARRLLFIVFTIRDDLIRVVSARPMSRRERRVYEHAKEAAAETDSTV